MKLDLTPEQAFFHGTTRQFLDDKVPTSRLRELRDDPAGFGRDFWRQGADLGWTSLLVSEADGGGSVGGQGLVDLALVAFEFGRYAAPGPPTATNVATAAVGRSGTADQKAELLPGLLAGDQIGSWAYAEPRPFDQLGAVGVRATPSDGQYLLSGVKAPVEAAVQADPASAVLGGLNGVGGDVERQLQIALVIQLAQLTGTMDRGLELTTEWLFNRYSFGDGGRPSRTAGRHLGGRRWLIRTSRTPTASGSGCGAG